MEAIRENQLIDVIQIELKQILKFVTQNDEGEFHIDLKNEKILISMLIIIYVCKTISYEKVSKKSKRVIEVLAKLFDEINNGQGFNSKRVKEISICLTKIEKPENIYHGQVRKRLDRSLNEFDQELTELSEDLINDLKIIINDQNKLVYLLFSIISIVRFLNLRKFQFAFLYDQLNNAIDQPNKIKINVTLYDRIPYLNNVKRLLLNILLLKELPIVFIALVSLFSFFIGNQWEKNFLIISSQEPEKTKFGDIKFQKISKIKYPNCISSIAEATDIWIHKYDVKFTSLQNDYLLQADFILTYNSDQYFLIPEAQYKSENSSSIPSISFEWIQKNAYKKDCYSQFMLKIVSLEKDVNQEILFYTNSEESPILIKNTIDNGTSLKKSSSFLILFISVFNNHAEWLIGGLSILFLIYLFVYANYKD